MSKDSFYWLYNPPVPPSPDPLEAALLRNLKIPTFNPVGLLYFTDDSALGYLKQRDSKASLFPLETRYYLSTYWSCAVLCNFCALL
jgi:hypothetical protein